MFSLLPESYNILGLITCSTYYDHIRLKFIPSLYIRKYAPHYFCTVNSSATCSLGLHSVFGNYFDYIIYTLD